MLTKWMNQACPRARFCCLTAPQDALVYSAAVDTRREFLKMVLGLPGVQRMLHNRGLTSALEPTLFRVDVPVPGLDRKLDGVRIGQITDVHLGFAMPLGHLAEAVALLEPDPPEILAVTGDLLDDIALAPGAFEILQRVHAPYGRFFIMGNHDNEAGRQRVLEVARGAHGFTTLVNEELDLMVGGARVHVSGVDFPKVLSNWDFNAHISQPFVEQSTRRLEHADFRLCLVHHPDNWDFVVPKGIELTLSGHTHGGQVAPFGPAVAQRVFKYLYGLYQQGPSRLYVSGGTGHWFPYRLGVPSEVTVLTLRRA